jgi:hypothetical protein
MENVFWYRLRWIKGKTVVEVGFHCQIKPIGLSDTGQKGTMYGGGMEGCGVLLQQRVLLDVRQRMIAVVHSEQTLPHSHRLWEARTRRTFAHKASCPHRVTT